MLTLKKFDVKHKDRIIYKCNFVDEVNTRHNIFTTLLIGENGCGKSYLLKIISDFLRYAVNAFQGHNIKYDFVELDYTIRGEEYKLEKVRNEFLFFKNSERCSHSNMEFPSCVLALSFMVNDKFTFSNNHDGYYKYLGVRASSNSSYTSSIQKKLLVSLISALKEKKRTSSLKKVLKFIGMKSEFEIIYALRRKTLFSHNITVRQISSKINSILKRKKYVGASLLKELNLSKEKIIGFINSIKCSAFIEKDTIKFHLNLDDIENSYFLENLKWLEMLEDLEFITTPNIQFRKEDTFSFEYTSSGEKHLIFTMLNLISNISENSLILIDEPELSLHPSWQMKYVNLLKEITKDFKGSHCLLASHSHFMVSNLSADSSSLVIIRKDSNEQDYPSRTSELVKYSTFAWSAENILYKVFGLRTSRNYYFEYDLSHLLGLISENSTDYDEIRSLHNKLSAYVFDSNDPIILILSQAKVYIDGVADDRTTNI